MSALSATACKRAVPASCDSAAYFHGWKCHKDVYGPIVWVRSLDEVVGAVCFPYAPLGKSFLIKRACPVCNAPEWRWFYSAEVAPGCIVCDECFPLTWGAAESEPDWWLTLLAQSIRQVAKLDDSEVWSRAYETCGSHRVRDNKACGDSACCGPQEFFCVDCLEAR